MATLTNNTIPEKTIERLSEYRRTLLASHKQGITPSAYRKKARLDTTPDSAHVP